MVDESDFAIPKPSEIRLRNTFESSSLQELAQEIISRNNRHNSTAYSTISSKIKLARVGEESLLKSANDQLAALQNSYSEILLENVMFAKHDVIQYIKDFDFHVEQPTEENAKLTKCNLPSMPTKEDLIRKFPRPQKPAAPTPHVKKVFQSPEPILNAQKYDNTTYLFVFLSILVVLTIIIFAVAH